MNEYEIRSTWKQYNYKVEVFLFFHFLIHFQTMLHFYTPWKHQKISSFLMFSGGIEKEHW